jgi:Na+/H+ antiporter NhaD/arsenite permease-like protein
VDAGFWIGAVLLGAVYIAVAFRQLSGRGLEVWALFGLGALATIVVGLLGVPGLENAALQALPVIVFLFALFLFASELDRAGAIRHVARWLVARTPHARELPLVLFVGFGAASAFLVNDALVVVGVPLFLAVAAELELEPAPLLLTLAFSVTVGSVLTPLGNPQNLLVSISSGIADPIATFLRYLLLPTAINLVAGGLYLRFAYRSTFAKGAVLHHLVHQHPPRLFPSGGWARRIRAHPALLVFPATMVALFGSALAGSLLGWPTPPVDEIALAGGLVLLVVAPLRVALLKSVDWRILALFVGLFVVVGGAEASGVVAALERTFAIPGPGHPALAIPVVIGASLGGAQLFSNVPWVALQISALHGLGYGAGTPVVWMALAAGSTLAGNLTLLGAASNIIVVDQADRAGVRIRLGAFVRHGLPITAITVAVLYLCLTLGL